MFYGIVKDSSSHPDEATIKEWLHQLQSAVESCISIVFSSHLAQVLINRANYLKWKVRQLRGSIPRQRFLQQLWKFSFEREEQEATPTRSTALTKPSGKRRRTSKQYSKRHERRLKRQRLEDISNSLTWLQDEGLTPIKLTVVNRETQEIEAIELPGLEEALCLNDETVDRSTEEQVLMMLYVKDRFNVSASLP